MTFTAADTPTLEDALGLGKYADALAEFVTSCETPMTVGIQGEWGSGKTSLMKMIEQRVERLKYPPGSKEQSVPPPWMMTFETWQYGAVGNDALLGVHLLTAFTDRIRMQHEDDGRVAKAASKVFNALKAVSRSVTAGLVNLSTGSLVDGGTLVGDAPPATTPLPDLMKLKSDFSELVAGIVAKTSKSKAQKDDARFIIFVDDLDRVRPESAVSLLEVMKNFMDVPHCIFIIACDYEVVREGVRERFRIRDEGKARAFFEKIIQVPFQMPVSAYSVTELFLHYLVSKQPFEGKAGKARAGSLSKSLGPLVSIATGTNPRAFKRFLNALVLHACLATSPTISASGGKGAKDAPTTIWDSDSGVRSLVGLVALQLRWPSVAAYVSQLELDKLAPAFASLRDGLLAEEHPPIAGLLRAIRTDSGARDQDSADWIESPSVTTLSSFVGELWTILDADPNDGMLTDNELRDLHRWSKELSLTQVSRIDTRPPPWMQFESSLRRMPWGEAALAFVGKLQAERSSNLLVQRYADRLAIVASVSGRMPTLLSVAADGTIKHNLVSHVAQRHELPFLASIGAILVRETSSIGFEWREAGLTGMDINLATVLISTHASAFETAIVRALRRVKEEIAPLLAHQASASPDTHLDPIDTPLSPEARQ